MVIRKYNLLFIDLFSELWIPHRERKVCARSMRYHSDRNECVSHFYSLLLNHISNLSLLVIL